jgi:two-component system sensor histidine kinase UhpB
LALANSAEDLVYANNNDSGVERKAAWIRDTAVDTAARLREVSLDLSPSILSDLGLVPALRWLADRVNGECGINFRIIVNGAKYKLSHRVEIIVFRVVQEAMTNIKRHSQASEAVVTFEFDAEHLRITIEDNGQGFRLPRKFGRLAAEGKLGLVGMEERVNSLGGTLQVRSKPGKGTILSFEVEYEIPGNNHSDASR